MGKETKRLMRQAADLQRSLDAKDVLLYAESLQIKALACVKNGRHESASAYAKVSRQLEQLARSMTRTQGVEKA